MATNAMTRYRATRPETTRPMRKMTPSFMPSPLHRGLDVPAEREDRGHPQADVHPGVLLAREPEVDREQEREERGGEQHVVVRLQHMHHILSRWATVAVASELGVCAPRESPNLTSSRIEPRRRRMRVDAGRYVALTVGPGALSRGSQGRARPP